MRRPLRRRRGLQHSRRRRLEQGRRPDFCLLQRAGRPQGASQADLDTLEATAGNPTVPPAWKDNATALFQDALAQAKKERAPWPYDWVNGVDYPHKDQRGNVTGQLVLNDPQAATTKLPHLTVGLAHPDYTGRAGGFVARAGNGNVVTWAHDGNYYQFWTDGTEDGKFTISDVRPGTYTLHAFADGVLGEFAQSNITVVAGQDTGLGQDRMEARALRQTSLGNRLPRPHRRQIFQGRRRELLALGLVRALPLLFPNDITYTIGKSDYHKDWFFEQVPHADIHCVDKSRREGPRQPAFWLGQGRDRPRDCGTPLARAGRPPGRSNSTWTRPRRARRPCAWRWPAPTAPPASPIPALPESRGGGQRQERRLDPDISTNAIRYNTDKGVWREYAQTFDAALLKAGENEIQLPSPPANSLPAWSMITCASNWTRIKNSPARPRRPICKPASAVLWWPRR